MKHHLLPTETLHEAPQELLLLMTTYYSYYLLLQQQQLCRLFYSTYRIIEYIFAAWVGVFVVRARASTALCTTDYVAKNH